MRAILAIAGTTIGEAIRRRVLLVILLVGLLFLVIAPGLNFLTPRQEQTVLIAMTLGIIQITSAVIAVVLTVYMIPNEIERRTIYTILSKPVNRWQFLIGKYLGAVGALGIMMLLMTTTLLVVFAILQNARSVEAIATLAKPPVMFFLQMSLLAAVAVFFSTFVTPVVNFFLSGGVYLVGSLFNSVFQSIATDKDTPALVQAAGRLIHTIVPNFANFSVQNPVINQTQQIRNEGIYFLSNLAYALVYIVILLLAGIMIFDRREV